MFMGLKILRIEISESKEDVYNLCIKTADMNRDAFDEDDEHRLLIDVSRGVLGIYEGIRGIHQGYNLIIADFPLKWTVSTMGHLFDTGINSVITSQSAIPASLLITKKS